MSEVLALSKEARRLGRSDLTVAPIAYGCWRFAGTDVATARAKVEAALEAGMTLFDHADIYGGAGAAEDLFGKVLAEAPELRRRMAIATKCGIVKGIPYDSRPAHIRTSCDASLRRLGVDTIDLYQIHRPDLLTHPHDVAETLAHLRTAGKIREVGVSNHTASQFHALQEFLDFPIATHQPEFSPWCLDPLHDGVLDQCLRERVTPLAWSPMAGGRLGMTVQAAWRRPDGDRLVRLLTCLDRLAERESVPRIAIAFAFVMVHPARPIPIVGSQTADRIRDAARAYDVRLTRADWYDIVEASRGERLP